MTSGRRALWIVFASLASTGLGCTQNAGRIGGTGGVRMGGQSGGVGGGAGGLGGTISGTGGVAGAGGAGDAGGMGGADAKMGSAWAEWPMPNVPADVAAGAPHPKAYTDNTDGTVTDDVTGLMWQQTVPDTTFAWTDAIAYCPMLSLAGHHDWRLPSRIELVSITDDSGAEGGMGSTTFPNTPSDPFWSSTPAADTPTDAWAVVFAGGTYSVTTSDTNNVRCVR